MSVPKKCQVLVIGGGPAGSYASTVLAREGVDVVTLEADNFPRYHVGESMLPSLGTHLKFIGLYERFTAMNWFRKDGAVYFLNRAQPPSIIDFGTEERPDTHGWNVNRADLDDLLFKYAGECGSKTFDGTKVNSIQFEPCPDIKVHGMTAQDINPGRPVSATWSRKDGTSGSISFDYLVDGSGRQGVLSTRYIKNRTFNEGFRSIAFWAYWTGCKKPLPGTTREGYTTFEALKDGSGWCWFIPMHGGITSVGFVQNQKIATERKKKQDGSTKTLYMDTFNSYIKELPPLFEDAKIIEEKGFKTTSDWSYSASHYALPYARIIGDAGAFIDPFLSSGCHLAMTGGLSAAATIMASIKGDLDEEAAGAWHSKKQSESYFRMFLTVSAFMEQIWAQEKPVINDANEEGYERAIATLRPGTIINPPVLETNVMQGDVDVDDEKRISRVDINKVYDFCARAFDHFEEHETTAIHDRLKQKGIDLLDMNHDMFKLLKEFEKELSVQETRVLEKIRAGHLCMKYFGAGRTETEVVDGLQLNMVSGKLSVVPAAA
ncbi:hypothetical protein L249_4015 [Ophiocordyceps polyrhachis-furcata BCC 54312]|uniref:FAD-binding domain-containing protein n=1 Tax=Ophiocordyceps polyrhachis-furcata BCC 54312 TaxID=1330021 RepID=A0A367L6H3_9HYPO|nr:hypothetical protein L249_4015 [Ophiocordyceps polyrhachis-furcata BCC 54312]